MKWYKEKNPKKRKRGSTELNRTIGQNLDIKNYFNFPYFRYDMITSTTSERKFI